MSGVWMRRAALCGLVVAIGCVVGAVPASADGEDAFEKLEAAFDALEDRVKDHKSDDDLTALVGDIKEAEALYAKFKALGEHRKAERLAEDCVELIGDLTRTRRQQSEARVIEAGLQALGRLGDPEGAKYVRTYLRQSDDEEVPPHIMTALKAAGEIHDDSYYKSLMKLVEKSKVPQIAVAAMEALGKYGHNKRVREKILVDLVDTVKKDRPGTRPSDRTGPGSTDPVHTPYSYGGATGRWQALSPVLPKVLNELTGESFATVDEWAEAVDNYDRDLEALFSNKDLAAEMR